MDKLASGGFQVWQTHVIHRIGLARDEWRIRGLATPDAYCSLFFTVTLKVPDVKT
jgi:hypothetical protein